MYGSYGEASGEAGDSCSTLVYETTVTLLEANPSRLRTSQTWGGKRVEELKSRELPQAIPQ